MPLVAKSCAVSTAVDVTDFVRVNCETFCPTAQYSKALCDCSEFDQ